MKHLWGFEESEIAEQVENSPVDEAWLHAAYTSLLDAMDEHSTKGEKTRMSPTLGQAFMSLENLSNESHEKRYKKLYELSKRYIA